MLEHEHEVWGQGFERVAGVDEAGRGPLAGPVVAAAVVLDRAYAEIDYEGDLAGLNDSKQLSASRREAYFSILQATPHADIGIGCVDSITIDEINILQATHQAMSIAVDNLGQPPDFAIIDGRTLPELTCPAQAVTRGDQASLSIAAASVVAKVTRDRMMIEFDAIYPPYGFARHKGYGSKSHFQALMEHGPTPIHRRSFRPVRESEEIRSRSATAE